MLVTQRFPSPRRRAGPSHTLNNQQGVQCRMVGWAPAFTGATGDYGYGRSPEGERELTPGSNGRRPVRFCSKAGRAWLAWLACERRTGTTRNVHSALCIGGRRPNFLDGARSRPCRHTLGAYPRFCRGCRSLPLPMSFGGYSARCPSIFKENATDKSAEHRPSSGGRERSANRLRTRCERAYNRYGDKCQDRSPDFRLRAGAAGNFLDDAACAPLRNDTRQAVQRLLPHPRRIATMMGYCS